MLYGMILTGEIAAYFTKASVRAHTSAFYFMHEVAEKSGGRSGPKMDAAIREAYAPELAERIVGKNGTDPVYDDPQGWDDSDEPQVVDTGFFLFADEIDWDRGTLRANYIPGDRERPEYLFPNDELFGTEFERAEFQAEFSGMSFEYRAIEMLIPNAALHAVTVAKVDSGTQVRAIGRPPKWDWEGVLTYVVSQAHQPDGLPTGPGAQARLEEMIAAWFMQEVGDTPAASQIRQRAASISRMLGQ